MARTEARAGVHSHHRCRHHRHVDDDAIAFANAERLQRVGDATDFGVQFAIRVVPGVALLAFEADRDLVALGAEMTIEAIHRDIELAVGEPAIVRRMAVVERLRERRLRSEEHTSELPSLMRISSSVFCLPKKKYQAP